MSNPLSLYEVGSGRVDNSKGARNMRFVLPSASDRRYSNAQLYNYAGLPRARYPSQPPIRMSVHARFSHPARDLRGTAGFGFWNQPFMPGEPIPRLPRYCWFFFGGTPMNMSFVSGVPGDGWKAAVADFSRLPFLLLAPGAPLGFLLMRIPTLYRTLWPIGQWAIGAAETPIALDMQDFHHYRLDWHPDNVQFFIDDRMVLSSAYAPRGPLGFVAWMDNQYAVITPQGQMNMGLVNIIGPQWMEIDGLEITPLRN